MSRKLEFMLREWGEYTVRHKDYADEWGENLLCKKGVRGAKFDRHNVLCPDPGPAISRVQRAVNTLPFAQKLAVSNWYCAPLREDGNPHTKAQIAMKSRVSLAAFDTELRLGKKRLLFLLTGCE